MPSVLSPDVQSRKNGVQLGGLSSLSTLQVLAAAETNGRCDWQQKSRCRRTVRRVKSKQCDMVREVHFRRDLFLQQNK